MQLHDTQAHRLWIPSSELPGKERRRHEKTGDVGRIQGVRGETKWGRGLRRQPLGRRAGGGEDVKGRWRRVRTAEDT